MKLVIKYDFVIRQEKVMRSVKNSKLGINIGKTTLDVLGDLQML